jgi:integrase
MAAINKLAARKVQAAGEGDHADGGGLLLRVNGGRATWVLRFTAPTGKRREMGLGAAHRASVAQAGESLKTARDLAHEARELLRRGVDPIDSRDERRSVERDAEQARKAERERQQRTLARCARDYHARVIEPSRTEKHAAQWLASLENHVPDDLWHSPIETITAPAVLAALNAVKPHERARNLTDDHRLAETVRRIRQRLEAIFEDATFHGWCASNPAAAVRRKLREQAPRVKKGQFKALAYREAPALLARIRATEGTAARALEFAVLTAARTGEVLGIEWSEIDFDAATWTVPAERMKAREAHTAPLSGRAVDILRAQRRIDPRLVFPSPATLDRPDGKRRPLSNMAMLATLDRLGVRDRTTVHGLCRSTFSTWANESGAARPDAIEACLAHREGDRIRAAYNRSKFDDERRTLLESWAQYLEGAKVIPLQVAESGETLRVAS